MSKRHRLTRSHDRWLSGVCGGVAEFLGWRPAVVRMLWVAGSSLFAGVGGIVAYAVLVFVMPPPDGGDTFRLDDFRVQ